MPEQIQFHEAKSSWYTWRYWALGTTRWSENSQMQFSKQQIRSLTWFHYSTNMTFIYQNRTLLFPWLFERKRRRKLRSNFRRSGIRVSLKFCKWDLFADKKCILCWLDFTPLETFFYWYSSVLFWDKGKHCWPVHLNDKNVYSREDTFLSWHLAPA
jgi:hypothetical protein